MGLSPRRGPRAGQQPPIANERLARPPSQMPRSSSSPQTTTTLDFGGLRSSPASETAAIRPWLSPRRKRASMATTMPRQQPEGGGVSGSNIGSSNRSGTGAGSPPVSVVPSRKDPATSQHGAPRPSSMKDRGSGSNPALCPALSSWWIPGSRTPAVVLQSVLKKRAGRINSWADRFFVLTEITLDQYAKGEDATYAEPKHSYELDPSCTCSEIKDAKSGGKPIYFFHVDWPSAGRSKEEGDDEISTHEEEDPEVEAGGGLNSNTLSTPPPRAQGTGTDFFSPTGSPTAESLARDEVWTIPSRHPRFVQSDSSCSLTGDATRNGHSASLPTSPKATAEKRRRRKQPSAAHLGESEEWTRNETIEGMVAAQREKEKMFASFHREELEQLSELEMEKKRRQHDKKGRKSKEDKRTIMSTNKAVAITAVTVSWVTAGVATGGLFIAGTLVAAGITATVGSMGAYSRYKNKSQNGAPSRLRLGSDKLEVVQQWRAAILEQIARLREQPSPGKEAGAWMGRGLGALWAARPPEGLPPALKAIDLRVVDDMLGNASWTSRGVMQGLPILEQEVGLGGEAAGAAGNGGVSSGTGWGLGGSGPILKTQTIVRASPLETFVALMGAPKHSINAVVSGAFTVLSLDDHSDVVRLCLRPAWLRVAWASARDFCLARYWHMSEDGCYIVTLSSMKHPLCPVDPAFVRGEAQLVYTISPRRECLPVPGGHASPECLLCCHVQVNPKGWVWNRLGMQELYTSQILMHVLEVRNVIEAERFVAPRVSLLRPGSCPTSNGTPASAGAGPRSLNGRSFPFEVLGAQESEGGGGQRGRGSESRRGGRGLPRGSWLSSSWCSLERDPPPALDPRMWTEADAKEFSVRGPSYLTTKAKVPSPKQMFRLRAVDLFSVPEPVTHLAQNPANRVQVARKAGEKSFVWVLQLMVPGPPHYAFVAYFTPGEDNWMDTSTPFGRLASRVFFGDDDDFRDQRLKLIPKIVEGNWVVKRAAGTTPAILGTKLRQHHFKGDNYLETDLEIASSSIAANITRLCVGYAKSLVVDMVWTIQGNTEEELPEVALAGVRLNHLDFLAAKPLDLSLQAVASLVPESESAAARHHSRRD